MRRSIAGALILAATAPCAQAADSAYTRHDWEKCPQVKADEDWVVRRCEGFAGVPIFYVGAEDSTSVGFGADGLRGDGLGDFTFAKDTVEWRKAGDGPYAAILRYDFGSSIGGPFRSRLVVYKLEGAKSSCIVGSVDGAKKNANLLARELADGRAKAFRCEQDKPVER